MKSPELRDPCSDELSPKLDAFLGAEEVPFRPFNLLGFTHIILI